jgi:hypothetical protein
MRAAGDKGLVSLCVTCLGPEFSRHLRQSDFNLKRRDRNCNLILNPILSLLGANHDGCFMKTRFEINTIGRCHASPPTSHIAARLSACEAYCRYCPVQQAIMESFHSPLILPSCTTLRPAVTDRETSIRIFEYLTIFYSS